MDASAEDEGGSATAVAQDPGHLAQDPGHLAQVPGQRAPEPGEQAPEPGQRPPEAGQHHDRGMAPAHRAPVDGFAVATLISGILAVVPVTVILGPVALSRVARTRARGRALAITGLALAGLWIVAGAMVVAAIITHRPAPEPVTLPQVFSLHTGQCLNSGADGISGLQVLDCGQPHTGEVFATIRVAGHRYPGAATLRQEAGQGCGSRLSGYLNPQLSSTLTEAYVYPDAGAWAAGERTVVCTVRSTTGPLTGSVRAG